MSLIKEIDELKARVNEGDVDTLGSWQKMLNAELAKENLRDNVAIINLIKKCKDTIKGINDKLTSARDISEVERLLLFEKRDWSEMLLTALSPNEKTNKYVQEEVNYLKKQL